MASSHFQYEDREDQEAFYGSQLLQGDIIERTEAIEDILQGLYPYAHRNPEKYPFFIVLTQSCDLIGGDGRDRKAEHITLGAVRPIRMFLEHEVFKLQTPALREAGICLARHKSGLFQKVERLLSNEESPYFYLHPSPDTPFNEAHVAYLRITFPVRADPHYRACLAGKKAQLAPAFQAKLGWLTTLVFGRVATEDFAPDIRHSFAAEYIRSIQGITWWKDKELLREARRKGRGDSLLKLSPEELRDLIDTLAVKSQPERVVDSIVKHARAIWPGDNEALEKLGSRLLRDPDFAALVGD